MTSFPCLVWTALALGQNVWRDHLTPSVILQPSPTLDLKVSSCRGSTSELVAFTGSTQANVRDLETLRSSQTVLLYELSS